MKTHRLKTWPQFYEAVANGSKPFELRKFDRPYEVGDRLVLEEWNPATAKYTGRHASRDVTYMVVGPCFGLPEGHCIMGLSREPTAKAPPPEAPTEPSGATCKTCGDAKTVRYCACGCGLTEDAAVREAMSGPAALNRDQAEANIKTESRPCPDCATATTARPSEAAPNRWALCRHDILLRDCTECEGGGTGRGP